MEKTKKWLKTKLIKMRCRKIWLAYLFIYVKNLHNVYKIWNIFFLTL